MKLIYSDILPMGLDENEESITDCIARQFEDCNGVDIAVGYVSKASLEELDRLISEHHIPYVNLIIGMYYIEGMPEGLFHTAEALNKKWMESGIGEIRLVKAFKYHGKVFVFHKRDVIKSAVIGSANLGVMKLEANNRRQYEVAGLTTDPKNCTDLYFFIKKLRDDRCSANISEITDITLIREVNTSLTGVDTVDQVTQAQVVLFNRHKTDISFELPIKVPSYSERFMDDGKHFTKSNLNVSYAAPRSARKSRDWYETQFTVSKSITLLPGYPEKNAPFFVVTDDGYTFKAHTTSDGNKQFSAVGDELILGRWIKGRIAAAGLVTPVNDTQLDRNRSGMITKEMLAAYGCDTLVLTKTDQKMEDEDGNILEVWFLSFESAHKPEDE